VIPSQCQAATTHNYYTNMKKLFNFLGIISQNQQLTHCKPIICKFSSTTLHYTKLSDCPSSYETHQGCIKQMTSHEELKSTSFKHMPKTGGFGMDSHRKRISDSKSKI